MIASFFEGGAKSELHFTLNEALLRTVVADPEKMSGGSQRGGGAIPAWSTLCLVVLTNRPPSDLSAYLANLPSQ